MNERILIKMEYDEVRKALMQHCSTSLGKKMAQDLIPEDHLGTINENLEETSEAREMLRLHPDFHLGGVHDLAPYLKKAEREGIIEGPEFLMIYDTIKAGERVTAFFKSLAMEIPILRSYVAGIQTFPTLEQKIRKAITQEGEVSDHASDELLKIRRQLRSLQGKAREKMESMVRNPDIIQYLQDPLISIRNDRYVLPVKQAYRNQIPGIIHDHSGSGATVFIEPIQVIEISNETARYELLEKAEVTRILRVLTQEVDHWGEGLWQTLEMLTFLDFALAKGKLSFAWDCVRPQMNREGRIDIAQARHPLIPGKVVPINIKLGLAFDGMVITGPNTGGKTVTLKTLGLLTLMAQSGLHVPADQANQMGIFEEVYADIGDEQSISQSLSTFSSHMVNIISICKKANEKSLVLLDELGAGTDPTEGAALAMAIIEDLLEKQSKLLVTTHYSQLKSFASNHRRVENASVEFDVDTLSPTYRLLQGVPGRSNAFEISARLGLEEEIISKARGFLSQEEARMEQLLANLEHNQMQAEKDRELIEVMRQDIEGAAERMKLDEEKAKTKAEKILDKARMEALEIIRAARKESESLLKEMKEIQKQVDVEKGQQATLTMKKQLRDKESALSESLSKPKGSGLKDIKEIRVGDTIRLHNIQQKAIVLDVNSNTNEISTQIGIMKLTVKLEDVLSVESAGNVESLQATGAGNLHQQKAMSMSMELDLRGLMVDEAIEVTDKYLDDAFLAGLAQVTIIHGKGTGALRQAINGLLKNHQLVKSHRIGGYNEGGHGVSIVELKK